MSRHLKEIFLFGLVGVIGYGVDVAITTLLEPLLGVYLARIPAFVAAASSTWFINRSLTFKSHHSRHESIGKEYLHYLTLMIAGAIINYIVYATVITFIREIPYDIYIAIACGSSAGMVINYITSRRYIYTQGK